jgi:prevent-host-death family protein
MEVGMFEGKTKFSQLVALAASGEQVVVTKRGKPAVFMASIDQLENLTGSTFMEKEEVWEKFEKLRNSLPKLPRRQVKKLLKEDRADKW